MINHAATGWDDPGNYEGIRPGTMVPFQPGLFTVKAEVLGTSQDKSQYILMLRYRRWDEKNNYTFVRRYYYRDRKLIEGLTADSRRPQ